MTKPVALSRYVDDFRVMQEAVHDRGGRWDVGKLFLSKLMAREKDVERLFNQLHWQLSAELPDLGENLAIDVKAIDSRARRQSRGRTGDNRGEHDANWGVKSYTHDRKDGSVERKTKSWFGFKVHTIVEATYELPLAFEVTKASEPEQPMAFELLEQLKRNQPLVRGSAKYFMADRGYDDGKLHSKLWNVYGIKPVIGIRNLWQKPEGSTPPVP